MGAAQKKIEVQLDLFQEQEETIRASGAEFSPDRMHRYALWRHWDESLPVVMFIGLNPSTADERHNDPTVKKCIKYAKSWGYGGVIMSNICAFRATEPEDMKAAQDPVGPENDQWLLKLSDQASLIVAAWGNDGDFMNRGKTVLQILKEKALYCLMMNKTGHPRHPLFCRDSLAPSPIK